MRIDYAKAIGQKFMKLTVVSVVGRNARYEMLVECLCDCGGTVVVPYRRLQSGNTKSCGCLQPAMASGFGKLNKRHGDCLSTTYSTYRSMLKRCYDPKNPSYTAYGGRGVCVCPRWMGVGGYERFKQDVGSRPAGMTLDRYPDKFGNYEPDNVRWATPAEQARNTRTNHVITVRGETKVLKDWADQCGVTSTTILDRLKKGVSELDAVTLPPCTRNKARQVIYLGRSHSMKELEDLTGTHRKIIDRRLREGKTVEEAVKPPVRKHRDTVRGTLLTFNGKSMGLKEWSVESGIPYPVILYRLKCHWDIERMLTSPTNKTRSPT